MFLKGLAVISPRSSGGAGWSPHTAEASSLVLPLVDYKNQQLRYLDAIQPSSLLAIVAIKRHVRGSLTGTSTDYASRFWGAPIQ